MLVDLEPIVKMLNKELTSNKDPLMAFLYGSAIEEAGQPGVYVAPNFDNMLESVTIDDTALKVHRYVHSDAQQAEWKRISDLRDQGEDPDPLDWDAPPFNKVDYGVADNVQQILEYYADEVSDDNPDHYVISLRRIVKAEEPERGGWRWHKWGRYIGTKTPMHEYIHDEGDEIEGVFCFHLLRLEHPSIQSSR